MGVTKRPKHVVAKHKQIKEFISEYTCPACKVNFIGAGLIEAVVSFKCSCGQLLIVDEHLGI